MAVDVTFDPVAPNSANPEQAVNTALTKFAVAITSLEELSGEGVPAGGSEGQVLTRAADGSAEWADTAAALPTGGTAGQVLTIGPDGTTLVWTTPSGGGGTAPVGPGSHRYWRVSVTKARSNVNISYIHELVFKATLNGPQLATGGTPFDNNVGGGAPASNAFDGNNNTGWESTNRNTLATNPGRIGYDMGTAKEVNFASIYCGSYAPDEHPDNFTIEYSDNGTSYTVAQTFTGQAASIPTGGGLINLDLRK